ncbi:acyl-CoA reductase [Adlercreutzia sp. ZJ138]|uniref:acyl-CoA reductase n=1 Tax=Adlercreutzia sp. ZJ138 TaxID=2709405 RepID=UPI0013ED6648|nr:acyl-CoA reductase [Adlercreutzia sp. ZJ138]
MGNSKSMPAGVTVIAGSESALASTPRRTMDERDLSLLALVSSKLMKDAEAKSYSDVMSFAFWCRRGNLAKKAADRSAFSHNLGRGLAFHIAPSNVPVNFAFSWAFSLIAGNSNIVRVPSKAFPQIDIICRAIDSAMVELDDDRSIFVRYPSSGSATAALSAIADVRVIWGGNETVSRIRVMPSKPRCIDVAFADRFSIAYIDPTEVLRLDDSGLERLSLSFYNDTYLMDQNACSSPVTVVWKGDCLEARERFWTAVRSCAERLYQLQGAVATDKYVQLCRDAIDGRIKEDCEFNGYLDVVALDIHSIEREDLGAYRAKGGYFYELCVEEFEQVAPLLNRSCQTVTYFGVDPEKIREVVLACGMTGVDRVVPVGSAMDIDIVWDGMDLRAMMSRKVDVR